MEKWTGKEATLQKIRVKLSTKGVIVHKIKNKCFCIRRITSRLSECLIFKTLSLDEVSVGQLCIKRNIISKLWENLYLDHTTCTTQSHSTSARDRFYSNRQECNRCADIPHGLQFEILSFFYYQRYTKSVRPSILLDLEMNQSFFKKKKSFIYLIQILETSQRHGQVADTRINRKQSRRQKLVTQ